MTSSDDLNIGAKAGRPENTAQTSQSPVLDPHPVEIPQTEHNHHLGAIAPVDPRGRHELLRLAGGLAPFLHSATGDAIVEATIAQGIEPAHIERVVSSLRDHGVIALVDGVLYALGRRSFLEDIGVRPRMAELRVAERIERTGDTPYFIVAVARAHCLGVFGAPYQDDRPDPAAAH